MDWITMQRNKNIELGLTFNLDKSIEKERIKLDAEERIEDRTDTIRTIYDRFTGPRSRGRRKKKVGHTKDRHAKLPKRPKRSAVHKHKR